MNLVVLFIVNVYTCEYKYIIIVHPACKASRARIRLPISRMRKLKASSADGNTQQGMIERGPEPGVLTPHFSPLGYLNQSQLEKEHKWKKREKHITPTDGQRLKLVFFLLDLQRVRLDTLYTVSFCSVREAQTSQNLSGHPPSGASREPS